MATIELKTNRFFNNIEVKYGIDQYACHSHIHKSWSISYVLEGRTTVSLGTWESELKKDEFITIPPGVPHLCSPVKNCDFKFAVLNIPFDHLAYLGFYFSKPRVGKFDYLSFKEIEEKFLTAKNIDNISQNVSELCILLKEHSCEIEDYYGENLLESKQKHYIEQSDNRYRKYRVHIKKYGIGVKKISTIFKMEHAKQMLLGDSDLSQLALECGYFDQSHFTKVFKSYTGMNPAFYIKSKAAQNYNK